VQVGKETESDHGVLEVLDEQLGVQAEVQAVEQSLQQVQVQGGRLPPNPRHPHQGRVAEVDLQVDVVQLVRSARQEAAA